MDMNLQKLIIPAGTAFISVSLLILFRSIAFRVLNKWAGKTETDIDDIIIKAFKTPSLYWCIAIGLYFGIAVSDIQEKYIFYISKTIHAIVILSITIAAANLSGRIFSSFIQKSNLPIPPTGLAYGILKGVIFVLGFLIILSDLGISITPFITALGVGGLAVALALQDTLANLCRDSYPL